MGRIATALLIAASAVFAAACGLAPGGGGSKVTIPDTYHTSTPLYTLLYSTTGYEAAATKRVLVRQNDPQAPISEGLAFEWRLVDASGKQVAAGHASYLGTAWGIPIWAADFTTVQATGEYRMVFDAPDTHMATDAFTVDRFLFFQKAFESLALDNAEARSAPIELDNGFFDTNSQTGSVAAHANFLVGLLETYDRRRTVMTDDEKKRTRAAIDRAIDYLLLLSDPGSGKFASQALGRPYATDTPRATAEGLRALVRYAALFQQEDGQKAQRAFRRAKLAEAWLRENAPQLYTAPLRAAVAYDLYRYNTDNATLQRAADAVREMAANYDLRTMDRPSDTTLPDFEAMFRMWHDLPVHKDRQFWQDTATKVSAQYKEMLTSGPFHVVPPGVTDESTGVTAARQWDEIASITPPGDGPAAVIGNDWFISHAIDAVYLASITGDHDLEQIASASLHWVTGLNPGIPIERLSYSGGGGTVEAASFLTGVSGRSVRMWSPWSWKRPQPFATIVNGFLRAFTYDDTDVAGETSLQHDGLFLYAATVYEDYVNAGKRPAQGAASREPASSPGGVHVVSGRASESAGFYQFFVTVAGPDGGPLPAASVTVAWGGTPLPDTPPEAAIHTSTCLTDANGSCTATLAVSDLPVRRPGTVAVTNIEHPIFVYDMTSDDPSGVAKLP